MPETVLFEMQLEATADVVRACCGGDHEFGECPLDNPDKKEEDR